jgi:hypothetical protein
MKAKSMKRAFGLAAAAVSTSGAMMLAPAAANAATTHPAHVQTVSDHGSWGRFGVRDLGYLHPGYGFRNGRHPHGRYYHNGRYYNNRYYRNHRYYYR